MSALACYQQFRLDRQFRLGCCLLALSRFQRVTAHLPLQLLRLLPSEEMKAKSVLEERKATARALFDDEEDARG
jgi:hypothetical protein